jgi:hypothetical protein
LFITIFRIFLIAIRIFLGDYWKGKELIFNPIIFRFKNEVQHFLLVLGKRGRGRMEIICHFPLLSFFRISDNCIMFDIDFGNMFGDPTPPPPQPLSEQKALVLLQKKPVMEFSGTLSHDILKSGTLVHFLPRRTLAQVMVQGLVNEEIAKKRKIVRVHDARSAFDKVFLAQLRDTELTLSHPLQFLSPNVTDYTSGYIGNDGLLTTIGIVIDPEVPGLTWDRLEEEGEGSKLKADQLYVDEVAPRQMTGFVLVDYGECLDIPSYDKNGEIAGTAGKYSEQEITDARTKTVEWLKRNILPFHPVPIFSQDTGREIKNQEVKDSAITVVD